MSKDIESIIRKKQEEYQRRVDAKLQEDAMAKQVMHVGVAVATDGVMPKRDNILSIGAYLGEIGQFSINVLPQSGSYKSSPFWDKHPTEFEGLKKDAVSLPTAVEGLNQWLKQWQGRLIACTSSIDFWHLFTAMIDHTGGCPFGSIPIDTGSFYCGYNGLKTPGKVSDKILPLDLAKERWLMVSGGVMPQFGDAYKPPKKAKATSATRGPYEESTFTSFLRRQRDRAEQVQAAPTQGARVETRPAPTILPPAQLYSSTIFVEDLTQLEQAAVQARGWSR